MNVPPIVPFVGKSDSGKTTFLEKVIRELKQRGYRVAVIKHHGHATQVDQPGKDTWRHAQAGADQVVIASPVQLALFATMEQELSPDEIVARYLDDADIVLTEGYKRAHKPKIEVNRVARSSELICDEEELLAVVSDQCFPIDRPQFDLDDATGVVDLLERTFGLGKGSDGSNKHGKGRS
ncbi:MAG TPA: molybdopterin-guanine dinucleotide biosynthesis protein B [Anaerolineae bacterium]|nr:molybdopterin-guanine dinucleotide biosynthesis protein B [Anaerolineae bacterium]